MGFYVYMWLREDGTPYYVGKGCGKRAFRKASPPVDRVLLQEYPSEEGAFEAEKFLIAYYGRKDIGTGCLNNLSDGGEHGASGHVQTEEHRSKRAKALRGRKQTPEHVATRTDGMFGNQFGKGYHHTSQARDAMRKAKLGRKGTRLGVRLSAETRRRMSEAALKRYSTV